MVVAAAFEASPRHNGFAQCHGVIHRLHRRVLDSPSLSGDIYCGSDASGQRDPRVVHLEAPAETFERAHGKPKGTKAQSWV